MFTLHLTCSFSNRALASTIFGLYILPIVTNEHDNDLLISLAP